MSWGRRWLLGALVFAGASVSADWESVEVRWMTLPAGSDPILVAEVLGIGSEVWKSLDDRFRAGGGWARVFPVFAEPAEELILPSIPPMAGSYELQAGVLRFVPAFPPSPGMRYRAVLRRRAVTQADTEGALDWTAIHQVARVTDGPTTVVSRVSPSSSVVPENLLKFYVHFSAPMSRGHIYDHIHLLDAKGRAVELPFLEIDEELWNPEMTRLTLFLDPGRIKRGVRPLEEIGPSLVSGQRYTLTIAKEWRDASGRPLKAGYSKAFEVGPVDREAPDPKRWTIHAPRRGTKEALTVAFTEPMDDGLARRVIRVERSGSRSPGGRVELAGDDRQWLFLPDEPWASGEYRLLIGSTLEDLAGNNPGKSFEVDLFEGVQRRVTHEVIALPFVVP